MKILITGTNGFIAKNLMVRLGELPNYEVLNFSREQDLANLELLVNESDFIFHLAGTNRPANISEFQVGNVDFTKKLCEFVLAAKKLIPIVLSSSTQAELQNPYGISKRQAEDTLISFYEKYANPIYIFRLPNVFGKWAKPNYNSAVATFCNNIAHNLPIVINDHTAKLTLVYIDDVIDSFIKLLSDGPENKNTYQTVPTVYETTVGELASTVNMFKEIPQTGSIMPVGCGLTRALYSTYLSYLPENKFSYSLIQHKDSRGIFVEMLKTKDSGQFSFFTAHPGITRGGHYHHSKTEKFLIIQGKAQFRFRHILSNQYYETNVDDTESTIVETIPGWTHDITNTGKDTLIVMLWANEVFDSKRPDTIACRISLDDQ